MTSTELRPAALEPLSRHPERASGSTGIDHGHRLRLLPWALPFLLLADIAATVTATTVGLAASSALSPRALLPALVIDVPVALGFLTGYGLYRRARRRLVPSSFPDLSRLVHACLIGTTAAYILARVADRELGTARIPTEGAVIIAPAEIILLVVCRMVVRWAVTKRRSRVLVVGSGIVAGNILQRLTAIPYLEVVGYVDDNHGLEPHDSRPSARALGALQHVASIIEEHDVDHVLVAFSPVPESHVAALLRGLPGHVRISVVPRMFDLLSVRSSVDDLAGLPIIDVAPPELGLIDRTAKRSMDIVGSATALLLLAPVMIVIALLVRLTSPGPAIFRQQRTGRGGRPFHILKFRTMHVGSEGQRSRLITDNQGTGPLFKLHTDPRVTRLGRVLRATSLDELPQLVNVLKGDMSLVGPRPFIPLEARDIAGWAALRHTVRPGITGLWQICGRSDLPYDELRRLDYSYVASWSLGWDIRILWHTPASVLRRNGAY
ncbi:exopolysaccharide biosynthesis polyprenyl glycosylphosphotransferase [Acidimicrobiaceae bacterium USS-CC1]|uniref:Exopolysaccharide biosynthesis polyprenyl glycosylphosphotransferase n=1 Tax=Acidiferrimicrobium australe TaxID=2664430 RepID=A0ABW9QQA8_9ACTN|nr:exopolysaccharide biosynthesis polyprenyl glycosylphosphotransferase [Acidiferrimicrobium australe]